MQWSDIPFDPTRRMLRQFAALWLVVFGALAGRQFVAGARPSAAILGAMAVAVGLAGLIRPRSVRPIFVGWMVLAFPIGWTVSRAILAVLFYGIFTPVALAFRLIGRDPMARRRDPARSSYWAPKSTPTDPRRYLQQF